MNEWFTLAVVCVVFITSWLFAYFTLLLLVDRVGRLLERRQQAKEDQTIARWGYEGQQEL